ncbi:MAG: CopG family transcriptional regulator [Kiritimatiellae bacterium]|nr:CopG family transcriptional regulator [Kiritimatiellia bacterium]
MTTLTKRATVYLRPDLHKALRLKSVETSQSLSEIVNEAVQVALAEDAEDLAAFDERAHEPVISYEAALKELKRHGKI